MRYSHQSCCCRLLHETEMDHLRCFDPDPSASVAFAIAALYAVACAVFATIALSVETNSSIVRTIAAPGPCVNASTTRALLAYIRPRSKRDRLAESFPISKARMPCATT